MKNLKTIFTVFIVLVTTTVGYGQNVVIPLGKTLEVEVPVEYSFKAGTGYIKKTVYVKLSIENLKVIHKPIKQFAGKSMGVMDDEISVTHWVSYTPPAAVKVDGELIRFSSFIEGNDYGSFNLKDAYFIWTQGSFRYNKHKVDVGNYSLNINPKNATPGYTFNVFNIKDIVGTETKQQAFETVKGRGEIRGSFFSVGQLVWAPPYQLKSYLKKRDEQRAKETGYYTANGFTNKVKETTTATTEQYSATAGTSKNSSSDSNNNTYQNSKTTNTNRQQVDNYNNQLRQQGNLIYQQSQQTWAAYQKSLSDIKNMFNQTQVVVEEDPNEFERREKTRQQMEYLDTDISFDPDAGTIEQQYERKKASEREGEEEKRRRIKEQEVNAIAQKRQAIITALPIAVFPHSDAKLTQNKLYYFIGTRGHSMREAQPIVFVSNVFEIGKYPDGTYPSKLTIQSQINNLTDQYEYIHGYFTSAQEAQSIRDEYKNILTGLNLQVRELTYKGKNTQTAIDNNKLADYLGNIQLFGEAERAYLSGNYTKARDLTIQLEKQGFQKSSILFLKIIATAGIPIEQLTYEQGVQLKTDMEYYLNNYNIKGLEDKYKEVSVLNNRKDYNLGNLALQRADYHYGLKAYEQAAEWYAKSADLGNLDAQVELAKMYFNGEGVTQDLQKALELFQKAANAGHSTAQNNLGYMYRLGKGVEQDYTKAIEWYLKAAAQDNDVSQYRLGMMYYNAEGVKQDYAEAAKWLKKAAYNGHLEAAYRYSYMLNKGIGVEKNIPLSLTYIKEAARRGHKKSQEQLIKLKETW